MIDPRRIGGIFAILVIAAPAPSAQGRSLLLPTCISGRLVMIDLPPDPAHRGRDDCCRKGCHAASDRRKKGGDVRPGCC